MAQAFKLKFTGATTGTLAERVDLASEITLNANTVTNSLRVEIEFELDSLSATNTLCFAANFCRFQILNTGQISVQYRNQTNSLAPVTSATGVISVGVRYVLALQLSNVDRNARIFLNDVEVGTVTNRWGTFSIERLGLWPNNSTLNGSIYRVTCYQNGTIVNNYNPTIVLADPNTLVDEVGGNNGTMVNFPSDGSARVPYDDGGATVYELPLDAGVYAVTGQQSAITAARSVSFDAGQYSASGNPAQLSAARALSLVSGSYQSSGEQAQLSAIRSLNLISGSYLVSGQQLTLILSRKLDLSSGDYSLTGQPIALDIATPGIYLLALDAGDYDLSGDELNLAAIRSVQLQSGVYNYAGQSASLSASRAIGLSAGSYAIAGQPITLNYSGFTPMRIDGYSLQFKQSGITISYGQDPAQVSFAADNTRINYGSLQ